MRLKKKAVVGEHCVACGLCEKICPLGAIKVVNGVFASVDKDKCVGCGKCEKACPASVIQILSQEAISL